MQIGVGYKLTYNLPQSTPMLLTVNIHYSRTSDLVMPDHLVTFPSRSGHGLPRPVRQLDQPDRGSGWADPSVGIRHS